MRFLKHRRLHINMGNYEHVEVSATVEVDTVADAERLKALRVQNEDDIHIFLDEQLDLLLDTDVHDAAATTDAEDSFVFPYQKARSTHR